VEGELLKGHIDSKPRTEGICASSYMPEIQIAKALTGRAVLFAAHPDDEVIGAGGHLAAAHDLCIVHATNGAPCDMRDARAYGFKRQEDYAQARRKELLAALQIARIEEDRAIAFEFVDQETAFHLPELTSRIADSLRMLQPDLVLAPAYEGGHPDHDSLAFAVHTAKRLIGENSRNPRIIEYALYHRGERGIETGVFLPNSEIASEKVALDPHSRELKRRMFDCFATQKHVLEAFSLDFECFRTAPGYDFTVAPHSGPLFYDGFSWGVSGSEWRQLALMAMEEIGAIRA
jgi:LmbE family N-acetylglucosaminyl deacetylase